MIQVVVEHLYDVTWEWNADLTACTATLTCEAGDDEYTLQATITKKPTPNGTSYTARVTDQYGNVYSDSRMEGYEPSDTGSGSGGAGGSGGQADEAELPFKDVKKNDWFYSYVKDVYLQGLIASKTPVLYAPDEPITRAQIVAILWRLDGKPAAKGACPFKDVPAGIYYETAAAWANENGIVYGTDAAGTKFDPDTPITREQFAAIVYRYAQYKGLVEGKIGSLAAFTDANLVSAYAVDAFAWNNAKGIITGYSSTTLNPQGTANRAQAAVIFSKLSALAK